MTLKNTFLTLALLGAVYSPAALADGPSLPPGLGGPSLPSGLGDKEAEVTEKEEAPEPAFNVTGFIEARAGTRLQDAQGYDDWTLGELRGQLSLDGMTDTLTWRITADAVLDPVLEEYGPDLGRGEGVLDLREAWALFRPSGNMDLKLGRQILTWGTGDLLFINDLFPKDWNAFFIGRDVEYLKAPSDALKLSWYGAKASVDLVVTPQFDPDRAIDGRILTYYNPMTGSVNTSPAALRVQSENGPEVAARLYGQSGSTEWALYYYNGYWKSPAGFDIVDLKATYPELAVYGASVRAPMLGGIGNAEVGYYDSRDEKSGADPFTPNSQWRFLVGLEREIVPDLTGAVQYYVEKTEDYDAYLGALLPGMPKVDEYRQVLTLRLTQQLMNQNLVLSGFNFYSPTDEDGYLRLNVAYKVTDALRVEAGSNFFYGAANTSFFGQFEDNSNIYVALRRSF
ncbi:MAG: hypothetical protein EP340_05185 [Alphaproteobacteria bacterium]|nr:MAG: hypothetical protein EP340_05185 [Alphaproteobacteria bacterium]